MLLKFDVVVINESLTSIINFLTLDKCVTLIVLQYQIDEVNKLACHNYE